ncbi:hypothetical protein Pflav_038100 [Phytohabitans flavus]|uniref:Uncharacterized protein n=1 Tax=Phytohabitans flavus TaxID=1076124 RepID=A0A6F8XUA8_9ACTN|nr:hypothetical protein Pflav_038100 [Phytohabitans flavus]
MCVLSENVAPGITNAPLVSFDTSTMLWLRDEERPPWNSVVKVETISLTPSLATASSVTFGFAVVMVPVTVRPSALGSTASRSLVSAPVSRRWPSTPGTTAGLPALSAIVASFGATSTLASGAASAVRSFFSSTLGSILPVLSAVSTRLFAIAAGGTVTLPRSVVTVTGAATAGRARSEISLSTSSAEVAGWISTSGTGTGWMPSQPSRSAWADFSASMPLPGLGYTAFGVVPEKVTAGIRIACASLPSAPRSTSSALATSMVTTGATSREPKIRLNGPPPLSAAAATVASTSIASPTSAGLTSTTRSPSRTGSGASKRSDWPDRLARRASAASALLFAPRSTPSTFVPRGTSPAYP